MGAILMKKLFRFATCGNLLCGKLVLTDKSVTEA